MRPNHRQKREPQTVMVAVPMPEPEPSANLPRYAYTPEEAGRMIGVGRSTIFKLIRKGLLTPCRFFSNVRITEAEIQRFLKAMEQAS